MYTTVRQYSEKTNLPKHLIIEKCRCGDIPNIRNGKRYLFLEKDADDFFQGELKKSTLVKTKFDRLNMQAMEEFLDKF